MGIVKKARKVKKAVVDDSLKKVALILNDDSNGVPVDPDGNPWYTYHKSEKWIDGKYNCKYTIIGDKDHRPEVLPDGPIPVGSYFFE